jgi:Ca2+-binding RTX toxin-like protein
MTALAAYRVHSELALAAYAALSFGEPDQGTLEDAGMASAQARAFAEAWRVVTQFTHSEQIPTHDDAGNVTGYVTTSNGLSATVFEEVGTGRRYLAIRGTDDIEDLLTDVVDVAIFGSPERQAQYVTLKSQVRAWMADGTLPASFTVSGHSLGGFLAVALLVEFPMSVEHAYVYNAPGIGGSRADAGGWLSALLGTPAEPVLDASRVSNLRAEAGTSPIADLGIPLASPIPIVIENQFLSDVPNPPSARNHSQRVLVDALAVYGLYETLAPGLGVEQIGTALRFAGTHNNRTLENALDALRLLLGEYTGETPTEDRDAFYSNLYALEQSAAYTARIGSGTLTTIAQLDSAALAGSAATDFGRFIALRYLLPIALEGGDSPPPEAHAELYARWQADVARRAAGSAGLEFSDAYLASRALLWREVMDRNAADAVSAPATGNFEDQASGLVLRTLAPGRPLHAFARDGAPRPIIGTHAGDFLFGGAGADTMTGGLGSDHLEGGSGADRLFGSDGDDTLLALDGAGGDVLIGGRGFDSYVVNFGDSVTDDPQLNAGRISVWLDGELIPLTGGTRRQGEAFYTSADGRLKYWSNATGAIAVFSAQVGAGDAPLRIESPSGVVPGHTDSAFASVRGRPDLGISLVTLMDGRVPVPRPPVDVKTLFDLAKSWRPFADPLALDLAGDGFQTVGDLGDGTILFDHDANGVRNGTGWLAGADAWVALDRDGDGLITSGRELFGVDTELPDGTLAANGFAALAPLDTNGDQRVDGEDGQQEGWQIVRDADGDGLAPSGERRGAGFADLLLWRDENLNGVSEPWELSSLADNGIVSISLNAASVATPLPGGNVLRLRASFARTDGTIGSAGALDLTRETFYRDFSSMPVYAPGVDTLLQVAGTGRVRDLQEASAQSPALAEIVRRAAAAPDRASQLAAVDALIRQWADASEMASGTQAAGLRSDGAVLSYSIAGIPTISFADAYRAATGGIAVDPRLLPPGWYEAQQPVAYRDAVELIGTLERFVGQTLADVPGLASSVVHTDAIYPSDPDEPVQTIRVRAATVSIGATNWQFLQDAYAMLREAVHGSIAVQTRLAPYVQAALEGVPVQDFSDVEGLLAARRAADPAGAFADLVELGLYLGSDLVGRGWIGLPLMIRQWSEECRGEPALAPALADLRVRFRDTWAVSGTALGDVMIGSEWEPPFASGASLRTFGGFGDDLLFGGEQYQELYGGNGSDIFFGGPGAQAMSGDLGRDIYLFGRGSGVDSVLRADTWNRPRSDADRDVVQILPGVSPADVLVRRREPTRLPGDGSDILRISILGTDDRFEILDFALEQYRQVNTVRFADGATWDLTAIRLKAIEGTEGDDRKGADGFGALLGYDDSDDVIDGRGGNDRLEGFGGDDALAGGTGNDELLGGLGDDTLAGGEGNDVLLAGHGRNLLDGGPGDDQLQGGADEDVYMLRAEAGSDVITFADFSAFGVPTVLDVIRVAPGIAPSDVRLVRRHYGLHIYVEGTGSHVWDTGTSRNPDYAGEAISGPSIGRIEFADGTVWDSAEIRARSLLGASAGDDQLFGFDASGDELRGAEGADTLYGLAGNDFLDGGDGEDILDGGRGDDLLVGGEGNDRLIGGDGTDTAAFAPGGGEDHMYGVEVLRFAGGLAASDIRAWREEEDLVFEIARTGDRVRTNRFAIRAVEFSDGSAWDQDALAALPARPTDWDDLLHGTGNNDALYGLAGSDTLQGLGGDDTLDGGPGGDVMYGGTGNDVYIVDSAFDAPVELPGEGEDRIEAAVSYSLADSPHIEHLRLTGSAFSGTGNELDNAIEGTAGPNSLSGAGGADRLRGAGGDDVLAGGEGADIYFFAAGDGSDRIQDSAVAGEENILRLERIRPEDVAVEGEAGSLGSVTLRVASSGDRIELVSGGDALAVRRIEFDDGTVWEQQDVLARIAAVQRPPQPVIGTEGDDTLTGDALTNPLIGLGGSDVLSGGPGDDYLYGGPGNDTLAGGPGSDIYLFDAGDGADLVVDEATLARFTDMADRAVVELLTQAGALNLVYFAPGIAPEGIRLGVAPDTLVVTHGAAGVELRIRGFDAADALGLHAIKGFGFASLVETPPVPGQPPQPPTPTINFVSYVDLLARGFDIVGTTGADILSGTNLADRFFCGPGDDTLRGGAGNDRYVYALGSGQDRIEDFDATPGNVDVLVMETGIAPDAVQLSRTADTIVLRLDGSSSIAVQWDRAAGAVIERVEFADGTAWSAETLEQLAGAGVGNAAPVVTNPSAERLATAGRRFAFVLPANAFADPDAGDTRTLSASLAGGGGLPAWLRFDPATGTFSGRPPSRHVGILRVQVTGTDAAGASVAHEFALVVRAPAGSVVRKAAGDDIVFGNRGNETLLGGAGRDYLSGGAGDDVLQGGAGDDIVQGGSGKDVLRSGTGRGLLDGGAGRDFIYGGPDGEVLGGGAGNDVIRTGKGADVIVFNRGDGRDVIYSDGEGDNTLSLGGGIRYDDLRFRRSGSDLVIEAGGSDTITFKHWYAARGRTSLLNLQIVTEAMEGFDDSAPDPMGGARVNVFDARGLVHAFDEVRAADPYLNAWSVADALASFHLLSSDDAAVGGDLAYYHGLRGSLAGMSVAAAQESIGAAGLGSEFSRLRPFSGISEGLVKLA